MQQNYEEYCKEKDRLDIHKNITTLCKCLPSDSVKIPHLIFYGPPGIGKYSQALYCIRKYSSSSLKYERKMVVTFDKNEYINVISDVHYEIDMELLGCNSKGLFQEMMKNITDIIITKSNKFGIVLCKNFHTIHPELLDIFYSYMTNSSYYNIKFFILTENISFIPDNIINICKSIHIECPTKTNISKITSIKDNETIFNLKQKKNDCIINLHENIVNKLINKITDVEDISMGKFRETIYDILIYNINVYDAIYDILYYLIDKEFISEKQYYDIMLHVNKVLKQYNNNYRPIYHLENICYYLINKIHNE